MPAAQKNKILCVLLPGLDGTGALFDAFANAIAPFAEPLVLSYPQDRHLNYHQLGSYVERQLPKDRDYCIIAESFSGPIAILVASKRQENLKCVVLAASFTRSPFHPFSQLVSGIIRCSRVLPFSKNVLGFFLLNNRSDDLADRTINILLTLDRRVLEKRARDANSSDVTKQLAQIEKPILHLLARHDRLLPKTCGRFLSEHARDIKDVTLNAPHFLLQTEPAAAASEVRSFLAMHSQAGH